MRRKISAIPDSNHAKFEPAFSQYDDRREISVAADTSASVDRIVSRPIPRPVKLRRIAQLQTRECPIVGGKPGAVHDGLC